jgi:hypothetical protein
MSDTLDDINPRRLNVRTFGIAIALSMLVHMLALWELKPVVRHPSSEMDKPGGGHGPLAVQIVPPPSARPPAQRPAPPPRAQRPPSPPQRAPKKATAPPRRASPPVIALDKPAPPSVERPPVAKPPARAPAEQDLSSYIEARRRERSDPAPSLAFPNAQPQASPAEDANARANRLAAANLAPGRADAFGYDPNRGGGVFSIQHVAYDYAEFLFYGWNPEARRNTAQLIEVRKGSNPDIRLAIVRRMIAIIREHEKEEFLWESRRLGRYVTLSARARDNDGLEDFMIAEFFDEMRRVR